MDLIKLSQSRDCQNGENQGLTVCYLQETHLDSMTQTDWKQNDGKDMQSSCSTSY